MRVARKLVLALVVVIAAVLAVQVYLRVEREDAMTEADMRGDHDVLAKGLATAVERVWETHGQGEALALVRRLNQEERNIKVRWVWLDAPPGDPRCPPGARRHPGPGAQRPGDPRRRPGHPPRRGAAHLPAGGRPRGLRRGLELAESLQPEQSYVSVSTIRSGVTAAVLALLTAIVALALGTWFVGRPVQALIAKARRVGDGNLAEPLHLKQHDELSELAEEMNLMCTRLSEANRRLSEETQAKLQAVEQLRHADRLMTVGTLAAGIAHELGTPMNVIAVRAKMVADGEAEGEEARENGQIIREQTVRMTRIIRQLLDFARPQAPAKSLADVGAVARQTLQLLEPIASRKRVHLEWLDGDPASTSPPTSTPPSSSRPSPTW